MPSVCQQLVAQQGVPAVPASHSMLMPATDFKCQQTPAGGGSAHHGMQCLAMHHARSGSRRACAASHRRSAHMPGLSFTMRASSKLACRRGSICMQKVAQAARGAARDEHVNGGVKKMCSMHAGTGGGWVGPLCTLRGVAGPSADRLTSTTSEAEAALQQVQDGAIGPPKPCAASGAGAGTFGSQATARHAERLATALQWRQAGMPPAHRPPLRTRPLHPAAPPAGQHGRGRQACACAVRRHPCTPCTRRQASQPASQCSRQA